MSITAQTLDIDSILTMFADSDDQTKRCCSATGENKLICQEAAQPSDCKVPDYRFDTAGVIVGAEICLKPDVVLAFKSKVDSLKTR